MTTTDKQWLSTSEAAEHLNISTWLVRNMIYRGELKARQFGRVIRISRDEIDKAGRTVKIMSDYLEKYVM